MKPEVSTPSIDVTVSRLSHRLGGTVVGTVRVTGGSSPELRETVKSLEIALMGHCRLDERWHSTNNPASGTTSSHGVSNSSESTWDDFPNQDNTFCFWTTNRLDLLRLQERSSGRWEDVRPKPIILSAHEEQEETETEDEVHLEDQHLCFTFRVNLPIHNDQGQALPPTLVATSCRYYYTLVIRSETSADSASAQWLHIPVQVCTASPFFSLDNTTPSNRPPLQAMAHSSGLPCGVLTTMELQQWSGRLTVHHRHSAAHSQHICHRQGHMASQIQSMRVTDPQSGHPVCLLTVMGANVLHPGSRVVIKLDFPRKERRDADPWVPVHQASACIEGEEVAIRLRDGQRTRARAYLLDTAHVARIDPACMESVSLSMTLPLSAPCTVETERVEVRIRCIVDVCCGNANASSGAQENYRNLRLEIPCQVVHATHAWEEMQFEEEKEETVLERLYAKNIHPTNFDPTNPDFFPRKDIDEELTILSIRLADTCGLRPTTPYRQRA